MKKQFTDKIVIGQEIGDSFCLKSAKLNNNGDFSIVLSDKAGEVDAAADGQMGEVLTSLVGKAVYVTGITINNPKEGLKPLVRIKSIEESTNASVFDLVGGLNDKVIEKYVSIIKSFIPYIGNAHYKALVIACLTDENLMKMAKRPASLHAYGNYAGGALASCAVVTDTVSYVGRVYKSLGNGIYSSDFRWSLLLTASLLHSFPAIEMYTEELPYRKTDIGAALGYLALTQKVLTDVIAKERISLTDGEFADLVNALHASVFDKASIKAVTKEGALLRHVISLYNECDEFDAEIKKASEDTEGENSVWSRALRANISVRTVSELEESAQPAEKEA